MAKTEGDGAGANPLPAVLIVDDDSAVTRSLARVLKAQCAPTEASTAREALIRLRSGERFAAILVDCHLADMSGIALHEVLLVEFPDQASRIVLITGDPSLPVHVIPIDRVLPKPVPMRELKDLLAGLLARPLAPLGG